MKTITPTPSGAAVALRKFLATKGHEIKLGTAQEALARAHGYADWQALCAHAGVRGSWVPAGQGAAPADELEQPLQTAAADLGADDTYADLLDMDSATGICALLKPRLERVMSRLGAGYMRQPGRDDAYHDDDDLPRVRVSFDTTWGRGVRNELVFHVRDGCLEVVVTTWAMATSTDYQHMVVDGFELVDDAQEPDEESLTAWAQAALKVAADQRERLQSWVLG